MSIRFVTFLLVTFAWSWGWWIPLALAGAVSRPGVGWPTHLLGLLGPAIGAVVATAAFDGRAGLVELGRRLLRWQVSWPWALVLAATVVAAAVLAVLDPEGAARYSGAPAWGLVTVAYVFVVNGVGEETGWRGYLADRLLVTRSTGVTALAVGAVWGAWHVPLFVVVANFRDLGVGGTLGWAVGLLAGSVWLTWMYRTGRRSILLVALWHTAFNYLTATEATAGVPAAVASTLVMVAAVVVLCLPSTWRTASRL